MNSYINLVNDCLDEYSRTIQDKLLQDAIRYALFPGGKRLRPLLLLLTLTDLGKDVPLGQYMASAIEMIHTYSLIHDDLPAMDNDDERRGKPSLHKQFPEAIAILAGDALLTDSFSWILKTNVNEHVKLRLLALALHKAGSNGMIYGQTLDITPVSKESIEQIMTIHSRKTGDLFSLSLISAGILANQTSETMNHLEKIAYHFGIAFQTKDDIEDYDNKDNVESHTFPHFLGLDKAKELYEYHKNETLKAIQCLIGENVLYHFVKRVL